MTALLALTLFTGLHHAHSDGHLDNIIRDSRKYMDKYFTENSSYSCESITKINVAGQREQTLKSQVDYRKLGSQYLVSLQTLNEANSKIKILQHRISRSNRYMYQATKDKGKGWVVVDLAIPSPEYLHSFEKISYEHLRSTSSMYFNDREKYYRHLTEDGMSGLQTGLLNNLVDLKYSKVNESEDTIEFSIAFSRNYRYWKNKLNASGTIVIYKGKENRIARFNITSREGPFEINDTYSALEIDINSGYSTSRVIVEETLRMNGKTVQNTNITAKVIEAYGSVSNSDFMLSEIGITEPPMLVSKSVWMQWHVVLAIAGALLLSISVIILHRRNRIEG